MSAKITATFGADITDVEKKMVEATRATNHYGRAVKEVARAESRLGARPAQGLGALTKNMPTIVGRVKELAGAFGAAGAAAGLVPGLGVAAIGVAAVSAGVGLIRKHYEAAAEAAKTIADNMDRVSRAQSNTALIGVSEGELQERELKRSQERLLELEKSFVEKRRVVRGRGSMAVSGVDIEVRRKPTQKEALEVSELEAKIAELILARRQREAAAADAKAKATKAQRDAEEKAARDKATKDYAELDRLRKAARFEAMTDAQKKERLELELKQREKQKDKTAGDMVEIEKTRKKLSDLVKKIDAEEKARADAAHQKRMDQEREYRDLVRARNWAFATDEQKLAQLIKEGRAAQARYDKEKTLESKIALEQARKAYIDFVKQVESKTGKKTEGSGIDQKLASIGLTRGEDGKLRRGKAIVSEEDAARTLADRERNAGFQSQVDKQAISTSAERDAQARKLGRMGADANTTDAILKDIRDYLKPEKT